MVKAVEVAGRRFYLRSARSIAAPPRPLVRQHFVFHKTVRESVKTTVRTPKNAESGDCHAYTHPTAINSMAGWVSLVS